MGALCGMGHASMCNATWGDQGSQIEIELKLILENKMGGKLQK
jgi:hypothetical protein